MKFGALSSSRARYVRAFPVDSRQQPAGVLTSHWPLDPQVTDEHTPVSKLT